MRKQKITALILSLCLFATGCGGAVDTEVSGEGIPLLDPVGAVVSYEEAAYRDLYDAKIYAGAVYPEVEEYSFADGQIFDSFSALPGQSVRKNAVLAEANSSALAERIEQEKENLADQELEFLEAEQELKDSLVEEKSTVKNLENIINTLKGSEPKPLGADASEEEKAIWQASYDKWQQDYYNWEGRYRIAAHAVDTKETQFEQRRQLYELDQEHLRYQIAQLEKAYRESILRANKAGEVVGIYMYGTGDYVAEERPVIALGDTSKKLLLCDYMNSSVITRAEDVYAFIGGKRYEVEYHPMDSRDYTELTAQGETVSSTFTILDGENVSIGDFAVLVVVNSKEEDVLSLPRAALHRDQSGYYVYVLQQEEQVYTPVETGITDGVYTQITSGIAEGDRVVFSEGREPGENTQEVISGTFHSTFEAGGYLVYPDASLVQNPVSYGTTYFQEMKVSLYEQVEKGQVIATIRVQENSLELERQRTKLARLQERLADLLKDGEEGQEKTIASRREAIAEVEDLIATMEADAKMTEIRADKSGIVTWVASLSTEKILSTEETIAEIAEDNTCYVIVEDTNSLLHYGNQVTVSYQSLTGEEKETTGMVANMGKTGVSMALSSEYALILLPPEVVGDMAMTTQGAGNWWNRNLFQVKATIREMRDVLVVPKKAVWEESGKTYVYVLDEQGRKVAQSFLAGGYDETNYWVIEGLGEGSKVCLE